MSPTADREQIDNLLHDLWRDYGIVLQEEDEFNNFNELYDLALNRIAAKYDFTIESEPEITEADYDFSAWASIDFNIFATHVTSLSEEIFYSKNQENEKQETLEAIGSPQTQKSIIAGENCFQIQQDNLTIHMKTSIMS